MKHYWHKRNTGGSNGGGGLGTSGVLTIVFIVLKLVGVISWDWIWVLSPTWITAGLVLVFLGIYFLCSAIADKM